MLAEINILLLRHFHIRTLQSVKCVGRSFMPGTPVLASVACFDRIGWHLYRCDRL